MSAAEAETTTQVLHPDWCSLDGCTPGGRDEGAHLSRGSMLPVAHDDTEVTVGLTLYDDIDPLTGENVARSRISLTVEDIAAEGRPVVANLDPADARLIAELLTRYAASCERDRRWQHRYPAEVVRR